MKKKTNTKTKTEKKVEKTVKVEKNVRKLQRQNNGSTTLALPTDILKELKWRDKQKVVVRKRGNTILIEDWKPR